MPFIPNTDAQRQEMLRAVGVKKIEDLFADVPQAHRFPVLDLPEPASEPEVMAEMRYLAEANTQTQASACFLGAGAYHHFIPAAIDHILSRGEFYTAYTPYQPEVSQGTLQSIFEFQTLIAALTGMEAANASHYDGATAAAEAAILALQQTRGRRRVVMSPLLHPYYRQTVRTYLQETQVLEFGGCRIGLIHGNRDARAEATARVRSLLRASPYTPEFLDYLKGRFPEVDAIVFGHTHQPYAQVHNGIFYFNPGSLVPHSGPGSVGLLEIDTRGISGRILAV